MKIPIVLTLLLAACTAAPSQPDLVQRLPPPKTMQVNVPVLCVDPAKKPSVPITAVTAEMLATAEEAVTALSHPPPEIPKEQLGAWIRAIDQLTAALFSDFYKMRSYIADAEPLLVGCLTTPQVGPSQPVKENK